MQVTTDRPIWNAESISALREGYVADKTGQEIADIMRERFGFIISPKTVYNALDRFCQEERAANAKKTKERAEAAKARASRLIADGKTVAQAAEIMGVSVFSIYEWVPSEARPRTPMTEFNEWLTRFEPIPVPEDPIVDNGKLIFDLEAEDCRWPIGKDADGAFRFCGCQYHRRPAASKERPYCSAHAELDRKIVVEVGIHPTLQTRKNRMAAVSALMDDPISLVEMPPAEMKLAA